MDMQSVLASHIAHEQSAVLNVAAMFIQVKFQVFYTI